MYFVCLIKEKKINKNSNSHHHLALNCCFIHLIRIVILYFSFFLSIVTPSKSSYSPSNDGPSSAPQQQPPLDLEIYRKDFPVPLISFARHLLMCMSVAALNDAGFSAAQVLPSSSGNKAASAARIFSTVTTNRLHSLENFIFIALLCIQAPEKMHDLNGRKS